MKLDEISFNNGVQIGGKAVIFILTLVLISILTRTLGVTAYGVYTTVFTWMGILLIIVDMGTYLTGIREISKNRTNHDKIIGNILSIKLILGSIIIGAGYFILFWRPNDAFAFGMKVSIMLLWLIPMSETFKSVFHARLRLQYPIFSEVLGHVFLVGGSFIAIQMGYKLGVVFIVYVLSHGLILLINWLFVKKIIPIYCAFDFPLIKEILKKAIPLGLSSLMAALYFRIDLLMLSWMKPMEDVGIYGVAYRMIEVTWALPAILMGTMFPLFSKILNTDQKSAENLYERAFHMLGHISIPMLVGGFIISTPLIHFITGEGFTPLQPVAIPFLGAPLLDPSVTIFCIVIFATPLMFFGQLNGHLLIAGNLQKKLFALSCVLLMLNILLNYIMIPKYTYIGAALTTVFTELIALAYTTWIVAKEFRIAPKMKILSQAVCFSFLMGGVVLIIKLHVIWQITIGALFYSIILYKTGGLKLFFYSVVSND